MLEKSSDTCKLPTMAPAGLRREIETVLKKKKKKLLQATVVGLQGRKGRERRKHCGR